MSKKHKNALRRIILAAVLLAAALLLDKAFSLEIYALAIYVASYVTVGWDVVKKAFSGIFRGDPFDECFLMTVATAAAFAIGEFPEAAAVMLFYQVGELFQGIALSRSRKSIAEMMSIAPEYAAVDFDGNIEEVDPDEVEIGSIIVVRPGEKVPLDGIVIDGESFLDTSALTGESVPRHVGAGDEIFSGSINGAGLLRIRTTKTYDNSTVAKILELVENASEKKAKFEQFITRFARIYTPVVTVAALLLAIIPPLFLGGWASWIRRACVFLIVSCPCALVISVPLAFFGGIGAASRIGVLVKGGNCLEALADADTFVFDKTGTLTCGEFEVSRVLPNGVNEDTLLYAAAHGEAYSNHPIASSIIRAYNKETDPSRVSDVKESPGLGVSAMLDGKSLLVGSARLMEENGVSYKKCTDGAVYVAYDNKFLGAIVIADTIKDGAKETIATLKSLGAKRTVMLSGDRESVAKEIAAKSGIDEVIAELLPDGKVEKLESILDSGAAVCFVGDGINDAPSLMRADCGVAMGGLGSDAAIEAADVVLMNDDLLKLPAAIKIGRRTVATAKTNVVFALSVKLLVLALGALGLCGMWAAVFADVGVTIIATINSMKKF